jgi:hypothetical protein
VQYRKLFEQKGKTIQVLQKTPVNNPLQNAANTSPPNKYLYQHQIEN